MRRSAGAGSDRDVRRFSVNLAYAAAVLVVVAVTAAFVLLIAQRHTDFGPYHGGVEAGTPEAALGDAVFLVGRGVSAVLFAAAGWFLVRHRPRLVLGPLALVAAVGNGLAVLGSQYVVASQFRQHHLPGVDLAAWFFSWGLALEPLALAAIFVLFPDGTWPRGRLRWLSYLSFGLCVAGLLHALIGPLDVDPNGPLASVHNPLGLSALPGLDDALLFIPGLLLAHVILVIRWLQACGELRLVLRSLAVVTILATVVAIVVAEPGVADSLSTVVVLVVIIGGVLRHRVYGIDVVLNRTLVYATLSIIVAAAYGVLIGAVSMLGSETGLFRGVFPAVAAAFLLLPARHQVQRMVNRFLYGERDEPYAVVTRVGARLESAASVEQLLPAVLESLVQALRVPYAAVDLRTRTGSVRRVEHGSPGANVERFPLTHQGEEVGNLVVGRRTGETTFARPERQLLEDVARQVAVAAANVMLTDELVRSRERIINAAEEERRRLRRDLHDGLGPVLTAAATRVDASRNLLRRDANQADELLRQVRGDLTGALDELRRLVYALRPPALDELGLLGAVREHVTRSTVPVILHLPDTLPELPPALELAAYRIVSEAVTNVGRHARASSCTVSISCNSALRIEVSDDGPADGPWTPGVGLTSMRERTVELGGQCVAGPGPHGGGRVFVELPLATTTTMAAEQ